MGRHVLIELFHIAAGIALALVIARGVAWAVPLARHDVWGVTAIVVVAVVLMGLRPLAEARARDRAHG